MKVSFAKDIKPLFRPIDIDHMKKRGVKLDDFAYMSDPTDNHQHALNVQAQLTGNPPLKVPRYGVFRIPRSVRIAVITTACDDGPMCSLLPL